MTALRVVLDACVLIPQTLNDLLLTLAEAQLFQPIWSAQILDEVERNLIRKLGVPEESASRRVSAMRSAFPLAEEESIGYELLIPTMLNDPKDRHVAACAARSGSGLIVTANLKDFPARAMSPFTLEAVHPSEFLCDLLDLHPSEVFDAIDTLLGRNTRPPKTFGQFLSTMDKFVPEFSQAVRSILTAGDLPTNEDEIRMRSLPVLTDQALASLEAKDPQLHRVVAAMDPAERARLAGHSQLANLVFRFLKSVYDADLKTVWPLVDPLLRRALATKWAADNAVSFEADDYDTEEFINAMCEEVPDHELWGHFERVHVRGFRHVLPASETWGIGASTRIVAPDVEVVYVHDTTDLGPDQMWQPGDQRWVFPVLLRHISGHWKVLNLGSENHPPVDHLSNT